MNPDNGPPITPRDLLRVVVVYRRRWLIPTVACGLLATIYALVKPDSWEASQALIVRNEAATSSEGPGKFRTTDEMKTIQETIFEIAKSSSVVGKALAEVGPPPRHAKPQTWPSVTEIDDFKSAIKLVPPKGAEFGKTEIFYLKVKASTQARAKALATALSQQIQTRFQRLLEDKATSMTTELVKTVSLSEADLQAATDKLSAREAEVGADLGELRMLQGSPSGESELRRRVVEVEHELRDARNNQRISQELLELLAAAQEDPGRLLATPNKLLESQPALKRLKDGLVDAQLRTAELLGTMSEEHPRVRSARFAEQEVSQHIHAELAIAIRGVQVELRLTGARVAQLEEQLNAVRTRLDKLASLRAEYANLAAEVEHRTTLAEEARRTLADARASGAGALSSNLIERVDEPDTGSRPQGPGKAVIVLAGVAAGLALGAAVLFLTVPSLVAEPSGELAVVPSPVATAPDADDEDELYLPREKSGTLQQAFSRLAVGTGGR